MGMRIYERSVLGVAIAGIVFFVVLTLRAMTAPAPVVVEQVSRGPIDAWLNPMGATQTYGDDGPQNAPRPEHLADDADKSESADAAASPPGIGAGAARSPREQAWRILTAEDGWLLRTGAEFERSASFRVESVDLQEWSFVGRGHVRSRVPFREVGIEGQVDPDGRVSIEFSTLDNPLVLRVADGGARLTGGNGWGIDTATSKMRQRLAEYDRLVRSVQDQTNVHLAARYVDDRARAQTLQSLQGRTETAMGLGSNSASTSRSNRATDGDRRSSWSSGRDGWLALRYREPLVASGVALLTSQNGPRNATLTVNGVESIALPMTVRGRGLIIVEYGTTIDVIDIQVEVFGQGVEIYEVILLD